MKTDQWHKPQDIWKYYFEECRGCSYTIIQKNRSLATYDPSTKVLFLQYFLRGITEPFKLRKQVQHTLKKHFNCIGDSILVFDQQKETRKDTTFVKLEFYGGCEMPSNEKMAGVEELIKKVCGCLDQ